MRNLSRLGIVIVAVLLLALPLLAACGGGGEKTTTPTASTTQPPTATATQPPTATATPAKKVTITLGLLTDKTGPASTALAPVDTALMDVIRYFNENNLIPGAKIEVVSYDEQYDPSKDIPGYEFLKDKGADFIFSGVPAAAITLKTRADEDKTVFFALTAMDEMYNPPGWVFSVNVPAVDFFYTLMDWIAQNDPDFPKDRPAKIGAIGMVGPYAQTSQAGAKAYCDAHPDQWQWVNGYLLDWSTVTFGPEVDGLKDCDYIIPPSTGFYIGSFLKEYRAAGNTAKLLATDAQMAYLGQIVDAAGWDAFDGTWVALPYTWWTEDAKLANLANQLVEEYHTEGDTATLRDSGGAYRGGFTQSYGVMTLLAETISKVGPENFNSQALYDTAIQFSHEFDGNLWDYSTTDRTSWNSLGIFKVDAATQDIVRQAPPEWQPVVTAP